MKKAIEVQEYDTKWPDIFEVEKVGMREALRDNCLAVHHIGSTSVPGLIAKPKIDIIVVVKDPFLARGQLEGIGIQYRGEYNIPLHYGFSRRVGFGLNVHVYEEFHPEIEWNLMFRDYLRLHEEERNAYARLKLELLRDQRSFDRENSVFTNYTLRKGDFIRSILSKAGFNRLRILKCNDETEWEAAKYFRDNFFSQYGMGSFYKWGVNDDEQVHLIIYKGAEIIGYAYIQFRFKGCGVLRGMVVKEDSRRRGFGSEFLRFIEKWLGRLGLKSVHAASWESSLGFYIKNGYIRMDLDDFLVYEFDSFEILVGKVL